MPKIIEEPIMLFDGFVETASMGVGYGSNSGHCQISLVYKNDGPMSNFDHESLFPSLGTACGIKIGKCSFGGVLQRLTKKRNIDGYKWDIVLESPGKWMEGIQIILDVFQGTRYTVNGPADSFTNQTNNIWNPFAVRENFAFGGIFGGSNINSAGFPALDALKIIEEISRGEHPFGGPAVFGDSSYEVDLSEVIDITPSYFRLKGPVQSLASVIQECCDIALHDYVVSIVPKNGEIDSNGVIEKPVIKVRVIDKTFSSDENWIKGVVKDYENRGLLVSADNGKEFPDIVTQRLVIGGPASRIATTTIPSPPNVLPIWGKKNGVLGGDTYLVGNGLEMNSRAHIYIKSTSSEYITDVLEVRCAMSGLNTWLLYHLLKNNTFPGFTNIGLDEYQFNGLINGTLTASQILDNTVATSNLMGQAYQAQNYQESINKIYEEIKEAGEEFYGRKFLVQLPQEPGGIANNLKFVTEDYQFTTSWQISDSAWSRVRAFQDINFYDSDGRLKSYVVWAINNRYDYSQLDSDWGFGLGGIGTHRIEVQKEIVWNNSIPYAVVSVPPVLGYDEITTPQFGLFHLCKLLKGVEPHENVYTSFGAENGALAYEIIPRRIGPKSFGIAQESNRYTWGPWWWVSDKRGKAEVVIEESFKPETFGSASALDSIAFAYANTAGARIGSVESGYIELADLPQYSIAEKFSDMGPYITSIDINLSISGITTTYKFNTWTPQFGKLAKYHAERMTNINKNQIRFLQERRSRWNKPALPAASSKGSGSTNKFGNSISPAASMHSMNVILSQLLQNQPVSVVGGNITTALGSLSKDKDKKFAASYEQIFSPAKIEKDRLGYNSSAGSASRSAHILPGYNELNPYFPKVQANETFGHESDKTDFQISVFDAKKSFDLQRPENIEGEHKYVNTSACLRGPMLLSGWGSTITGAATHNDYEWETDEYDASKLFQFTKDTATKRELWKTGPVDLLWDEERKVWCGGPSFIEGTLHYEDNPRGILSPGDDPRLQYYFLMRRMVKENFGLEMLETPDDNPEKISVVNRDPSFRISKEDMEKYSGNIYIMCIRINYEWRPIWVSCPSSMEE